MRNATAAREIVCVAKLGLGLVTNGALAIEVNVTGVNVQGGTTNQETAQAVTDGIREGVIQAFRDLGMLRGE